MLFARKKGRTATKQANDYEKNEEIWSGIFTNRSK